jgi:chromosomal replication initiator protein
MIAANPQQLWQQALAELQLQMRPEDFRTWFRDTSIISFDGATCVIGVENPFNVEWLSAKCTGAVGRTLQRLVETPVEVQFSVGRPDKSPMGTTPPPSLSLESPAPRSPRPSARKAPATETSVPISPRYTFDTFIVGHNNRLAHAASMAVADRPGQVHNPLFIYGGVGLGKTHLLHAIGHVALSRGLAVVYVSSETFTNEFIESISRGRMEEFRGKYRRTDVLLIDDIQFIAGKEQTQEEFFHTFNAVHQASGQIVLTSDRPPKAITTLEDRLRSRFVWGLMTDIQMPDLETRIAILRAKMAEATRQGRRVVVPNETLDLIASRIASNIRELEGALNRVIAYAELAGEPATLEIASAAMQENAETYARRAVDPQSVIKAVCIAASVTRQDLEGKQRDRRIVVPRQIAMYLLRKDSGLSLSEIGSWFGGRDHTTVLHSCEKIEAEQDRNEQIRSTLRVAREWLARPS